MGGNSLTPQAGLQVPGQSSITSCRRQSVLFPINSHQYASVQERGGIVEGAIEDAFEGTAEDGSEGTADDGLEGTAENAFEGMSEGNGEGPLEGASEGSGEGALEGSSEGSGASVGSKAFT